MEQVAKKSRRISPFPRWVWLVLLLAAGTGALLLLLSPKKLPQLPSAVTYGELYSHTPGEIASLSVTLRSGEAWTLNQSPDGTVLLDDHSVALNQLRISDAFNSAAVVSYEQILSNDPREYQEYLPEMGLDTPYISAIISYQDGIQVRLFIGDEVPGENGRWFYMRVEGDNRLFALDRGTVEGLAINRVNMLQVNQPVLHEGRIDRIAITNAKGQVHTWALQGNITDGNAADRWAMVSPIPYPADGTVMKNMRDHLSHLYIGPRVDAATPGSLTEYGFDHPQLQLTIHQQAGRTHSTGTSGAMEMTDHPESTLTLAVGNAKNDVLNYVMYEGHIHVMSRHITDALVKLKAAETLSHYLLHMDATSLSTLTVEQEDKQTVYRITRSERVSENNELVRDPQGKVQWDFTVTKNGTPMAWDTFSAWYDQLTQVQVSGLLDHPSHTPPAHWHTRIITEDIRGGRDEVVLSQLDGFQDTVTINGTAMFYLTQGELDSHL